MFQIHFKFLALHSATAPSTFLITPEATELGRNSEHTLEFSEQKQILCVHKGHTKTQRVHTLPV